MIDESPKIIIFGDVSSGKSMFIHKFLTELSGPVDSITVGVDFYVKTLTVDGRIVKLQVLNFGGEERFMFLLSKYIKGSLGGLFLYDVTDHSSIAHIDDWLRIIRKEIKPEDKFPILMIGIITDERNTRQVSAEEGIKIANSRKLSGSIECNIETGKNVEEAFKTLVRMILAGSVI
jgi:Ras-related protein Rab-18